MKLAEFMSAAVPITRFPERHRHAMRDALDPIHRACDFYVPPAENSTLDIVALNQRLHSDQVWAPWPDYLIAFASHGCGDYFAYDVRSSPARIVYIGGEYTPEESLRDPDNANGETFDEWYESLIAPLTCPRCGRLEIRFEASEDKRLLLRVCPVCGFRESSQAIDP